MTILTVFAIASAVGAGVVLGVVVGGWILLRLMATVVNRLPDDLIDGR